jgi:hypothetical protein
MEFLDYGNKAVDEVIWVMKMGGRGSDHSG